ncbi:MAG: hypothetical protein K8R23_07750 [Chthoniobacter sp.]|nr:hypothetical protein [Chthoniobacter sp.]
MKKTNIPEQYLTDYALNELAPEDRIYVESLLGASEEAREDVYQMIDVAMLLDEGFAREEERAPMVLTAEQRGELMSLRVPNLFLRRAAVTLAAAASVALAVVHHDVWMPRVRHASPAIASAPGGGNGMEASGGGETDYVTQLVQFPDWVRDPLLRKWFSTNLSQMFSEPTMSFEGMPGLTNMPGMPVDLMP